MPLDASIITNMQQPDFTQALTNGMNMRAMAQQTQMRQMELQKAQRENADATALKNAQDNNVTIGPDGTPTYNSAGTLKDLASSAPHLVPQVQAQMATQTRDMQAAKIKAAMDQHAYIGQLAGSATDQPSWDAAIQSAKAAGLDTSQLPSQYDPNVRNNLIAGSMNAKDQLEAHAKQQGLDIEQTKANIDSKKLGMDVFKTYGGNVPGGGGPAQGRQVGQGSDPAALVTRLVPPDRQAKALEEIKDNQNIAKIAGPSLDAFDQAAKEVRPMSGGTGTSLTAFVPGMESPGQKSFSGLANTTVKDVEGTARQAAFDSIQHNFRPQFGDSDANIAEKRAGWVNYLQSHTAAPTSKGYGVDLSKFDSTSINPKILASNSSKSNDSANIHPALKDMSLDQLNALEAKMSASKVGSR